ncbi:MAG: hypothetical protein FWE88_08115 [Phycisphaerae bacterium]|nr:hypothetical protein [Phycisphaerae bacterium]
MNKLATGCLAACLVVVGGCADSAVCGLDAVSWVDWPAVYRPSPTTLYTTPPAKGSWQPLASGRLAKVFLDERAFTVADSQAVYVRMLVTNATARELGVLLHAEDVTFEGRHVLPPPAGTKLAVPEAEFATASSAFVGGGPLPEQQVDAASAAHDNYGVLVTVPPHASLVYYRRLPVRRGDVEAGAAVAVEASPGVVVTDGRCFERLAAQATTHAQAPQAGDHWPHVPLGNLVLSSRGPARLVPSTQPNLLRPTPDTLPE